MPSAKEDPRYHNRHALDYKKFLLKHVTAGMVGNYRDLLKKHYPWLSDHSVATTFGRYFRLGVLKRTRLKLCFDIDDPVREKLQGHVYYNPVKVKDDEEAILIFLKQSFPKHYRALKWLLTKKFIATQYELRDKGWAQLRQLFLLAAHNHFGLMRKFVKNSMPVIYYTSRKVSEKRLKEYLSNEYEKICYGTLAKHFRIGRKFQRECVDHIKKEFGRQIIKNSLQTEAYRKDRFGSNVRFDHVLHIKMPVLNYLIVFVECKNFVITRASFNAAVNAFNDKVNNVQGNMPCIKILICRGATSVVFTRAWQKGVWVWCIPKKN